MATPEQQQALEQQQAVEAFINSKINERVAELAANMGGRTKSAKPTYYNGRSDPELWLYGVELYFTASGTIVDHAKIAFADTLLRDDALVWRRTTPTPPSWDEWKGLLISAFQPINPSETARDRLARLRQTGPVRSYASAFRTVTLLIPAITDDEKKDRFIRGLKPKIMHDVKVKAPTTFEEAVQIAVRLDTLDTWRPSGNPGAPTMNGRTQRSSGPMPMEVDVNAITSTPAAVRSSVNAIGTTRPSYRDVVNGPSRPPRKPLTDREREECRRKGICFKCRQHGHVARECPESSNSRRQ